MKKRHFFYFALLVLAVGWALTLPACHKDTPDRITPDPCPWPEITTKGLNTFGCKINGKEWVPCVDLSARIASLTPLDASFSESNGLNALNIIGTYFRKSEGDSTTSGFGIWLRPLHLGVINPVELIDASFEFDQTTKGIFEDEWNLPTSRDGFHIEVLRLDTAKNIISGTFEAILLPKYGKDTLYITDGRFDLKYYQK